MTIGNAMTFIKRGMTDSKLRKRLYAASSIAMCDAILAEENLIFSPNEFEEAFHNRLTLCQQAEEADQLNEFKMWWQMLAQLLDPDRCGPACAGCSGSHSHIK